MGATHHRYSLTRLEPSSEPGISAALATHRHLDVGEWERYRNAIERLRAARGDSLVDYIADALSDARSFADFTARRMSDEGLDATFGAHTDFRRDVTTVALNLLSAFYVFDQHSRSKGGKSGRKNEVDKLLKNTYADAPWLKLMHSVRHAVVHESTRAVSFEGSVTEVKEGNLFLFTLTIDRNRLSFGKPDEVASSLRDYVEGFTENPDLLYEASLAYETVLEIEPPLQSLTEKGIERCAEAILELDEVFPDDGISARWILDAGTDPKVFKPKYNVFSQWHVAQARALLSADIQRRKVSVNHPIENGTYVARRPES